jgi:hypothetical protein
MDAERTEVIAGIVIPAEQRTPLIDLLLRKIVEMEEEIRRLKDEIARLQGHSQRPEIKPSTLHGTTPPSQGNPKKKTKKRRKGKRPGSAKRRKTRELRIDETFLRHPETLPEGASLEGYQDFVVQNLVFESHNVKYRLAKYRLPEGGYVHGKLPDDVDSHFGKNLQCYILHQYYHSHTTQPLIREQLLDVGVDISVGQICRILTEGHDGFHAEKDQLLPAGLSASRYIQVDDTGARHRGQNGYCTHIGNEFFASFTSTSSKSRVNFLQILQSPCEDYVLDGDAVYFLQWYGIPEKLVEYVESVIGEQRIIFTGFSKWEQWLEDSPIESQEHCRIVTEAALWASLMYQDTIMHQVVVSDDAPQFKILGMMNALCWVHAERAIDRLVPIGGLQRQTQERVQDGVWAYYQRLKQYRQGPTARQRVDLNRDFDRVFQATGTFPELDKILERLRGKKESLLWVLERPEIPLHNNLSENDIRDYVKKRRISAGTRSALGRRCRDTFLSLKKTCRKLGISFLHYLQDRLFHRGAIPALPELIRQAALAAGG